MTGSSLVLAVPCTVNYFGRGVSGKMVFDAARK